MPHLKKESYDLFMKFKQKWEKIIPSAVRSLEKSFKYCTTFYSFPYEEWVLKWNCTGNLTL